MKTDVYAVSNYLDTVFSIPFMTNLEECYWDIKGVLYSDGFFEMYSGCFFE